MATSRIHLCRHGEIDPAWNGRIYGSVDVALGPAGHARFEGLAEHLARIPLAAVYSSDLARALDGARKIAVRHELDVRVDARFREIDRGAWAGLTLDEIEVSWPGGVAAYLEDPVGYREHGGENHRDLEQRVFPAIEEIALRHGSEQVLVLCHGQVMRVIVARILGIPGPLSLNLKMSYGGLTTIDRYEDGDWVVQSVNAPVLRNGGWGGRTFKP